MHIVPIDPDTAAAQVKWARLANNQRAAWLRAALKASGHQQGELADLLDLTTQTLSAWANGHAEIDWSRRMSILAALGLSQTWEPPGPLPAPTPNKKRVRLPPKRRAAH
jgi:transcriptional regulator with XRE-family HTH domain